MLSDYDVSDLTRGRSEVTARLTGADFAHQMKWPVDEAYPGGGGGQDDAGQPNIHKIGSLYEVVEPTKARCIVRRLEFHYTPNTAVGSIPSRVCLRNG